ITGFLLTFLLLGQIVLAAPPTVTITSPAADASVGSDFTVSGTATANTTIQVRINNVLVDTATSDGSGQWLVDVSGQTEGSKTIEATATCSPLVYFTGINNSFLYVFDAATNTQISGSPFTLPDSYAVYGVSPDGATAVALPLMGGATFGIINTTNN